MFKFISSAINNFGNPNGISGNELNINGIHITIGDKIAEGGYGCIYKATDNNGKIYAIKSLIAPDQEHLNSIIKEFDIQKSVCSHENIVKVYGMERNGNNATILMEFCTGECVNEMNQCFNSGFTLEKVIEIFSSVTKAVEFLHEQNPSIIHRDLKIENILFNNGKYKLCDFGSATTKVYNLETNEERNEAADDIQRNTTAVYRSPEMCDLYRRQRIDFKSDIWALGCILFKLLTFKDAFPEGTNLQILNVRYSWPNDKQINLKLKNIVELCFETNPYKRITATEILNELYESFPNLIDIKYSKKKINNNNKKEESDEDFIIDENIEISNSKSNEILNNFNNNNNNNFDPFSNNLKESSLIDFNNNNNNNNDPFITIDTKNIEPINNNIDISLILSNKDELCKILYLLDEFQLSSTLFSLQISYPSEYPFFYLYFIHKSGINCSKIINSIPLTNISQINKLIEAHKVLSSKFPEFEGNYSLSKWAKTVQNYVIGQPPICFDSIPLFRNIISANIEAFKSYPLKEIAYDSFYSYQILCFIISKLKLNNINLINLNQVIIPNLKSLHLQLKRLFDKLNEPNKFPKDFYNFDDDEFLQKIKFPSSQSL